MPARSSLAARLSRWLAATATVSIAIVVAVVLTAGAVAATQPTLTDDDEDRGRPVRAAAGAAVSVAPQPAPRATGAPAPAAVPVRDAASREALVYVGDDGERISTERVREFLSAQGSPLAEHAETIVEAGLRHDVDPRLVIAISAAESSFGTRQLGHNAWGWGASTTASMARWPDWPSAIEAFTSGLAENYDVDDVDEDFARRYVPPNWRWWLDTVTDVMGDI